MVSHAIFGYFKKIWFEESLFLWHFWRLQKKRRQNEQEHFKPASIFQDLAQNLGFILQLWHPWSITMINVLSYCSSRFSFWAFSASQKVMNFCQKEKKKVEHLVNLGSSSLLAQQQLWSVIESLLKKFLHPQDPLRLGFAKNEKAHFRIKFGCCQQLLSLTFTFYSIPKRCVKRVTNFLPAPTILSKISF